ncbi:MAG: 16S rRNA (cytidine(1402)-2'-O)-methyltransferase [Gallicola sp.]|nr:16S rRNA (cytidine(1402)-2'-O)-methyltransferase [Gallicola sp.]
MNNGKLYIVPTPIGNMEDMTYRAVRILKEADFIACEDTRHTGRLLKYFEIKNKTVSYHKHNEEFRSDHFTEELLKGKNIALVSDAGMPGINDPGQILIEKAIELGIDLEVLPGPTASVTALILSGFDTSTFVYLGFIPRGSKEQKLFMKRLGLTEDTAILYESVHRILSSLKLLAEEFPARRIALCRELTKLHEEVVRGSAEEVYKQMSMREILKGEFVLVMEGAKPVEEEIDIRKVLEEYREEGLSKKESVQKACSNYGLKRNEVYEISLEIPWKKRS